MNIDRKKKAQAGFTLAELLIVVAIIAVLVAVAIPIFTTQREKSKEATDMANVRSAYAAVVARFIVEGTGDGSMEVSAMQGQEGWQDSAAGAGRFVTQLTGKEEELSFSAVTKPGKYLIGVEYAADGAASVYIRAE